MLILSVDDACASLAQGENVAGTPRLVGSGISPLVP